ncbi:uncharacterized protein T551_02877 [Pneumocystis jirovecii RU7]|uniref:Uncharacterized protein n=1 Tax=Pneumocystis jirovecii (strain RU7) TaxID=1408657 RepID=A0A0W4ZHQ8_PNEJ7|nr:uncharacterized protein T551_02877 [Pneumocystis jirovecii RU7]KTW27910.1 hypothetical protein T551_02877 [Pneumocystis jirovecii RU7]
MKPEEKKKYKNLFIQKNATGAIRQNKKKQRMSFKISLNNPYIIQWPQIDEKDKEIILKKILSLFLFFSNHKKKDEISEKKDNKDTEKNLSDTQNSNKSTEITNKNIFSQHQINKKKLIAKYMTLGINETTKRLEMYSKLGMPSSAPPYLKIQEKDEKYTSLLKNNKLVDTLKVIFVCCEDIHSSILYSHFPILCGVVNEIFLKIETPNNNSQPGIRLVALPKGSEQQLSKAAGLKRLAAIGIMENTPHSEEIINYIFKKIPPVYIPWLANPTSFQATSIIQAPYKQ